MHQMRWDDMRWDEDFFEIARYFAFFIFWCDFSICRVASTRYFHRAQAMWQSFKKLHRLCQPKIASGAAALVCVVDIHKVLYTCSFRLWSIHRIRCVRMKLKLLHYPQCCLTVFPTRSPHLFHYHYIASSFLLLTGKLNKTNFSIIFLDYIFSSLLMLVRCCHLLCRYNESSGLRNCSHEPG